MNKSRYPASTIFIKMHVFIVALLVIVYFSSISLFTQKGRVTLHLK